MTDYQYEGWILPKEIVEHIEPVHGLQRAAADCLAQPREVLGVSVVDAVEAHHAGVQLHPGGRGHLHTEQISIQQGSVVSHSPWRKSKSGKNTHNLWHYFWGLFTKGNLNWGVPEMWDWSFLHNCKKFKWNLKKNAKKKAKLGSNFFHALKYV